MPPSRSRFCIASTMATLKPSLRLEEILTEQYFLKLMDDVADDVKVRKLAIHLNIPEPAIYSLTNEFGKDIPLLATKVLMAWQNDLTCDTVEEAKQELARALQNVSLGRKAKLVLDADEERDLGVQSGPSSAPSGSSHGYRTKKRRCTAAACSRIICYTTLGLLVAMGVATLPSLRYAPKTSNRVSPPSVKANDTVELSFSLPSAWIHKLSLSVGSMCNGTVYTHRGKCSSLYPSTRVCYRTSRVRPPLYLLPGSHLNFTIPANFSSQHKVWITWNPDYFDSDFPATSCDDPPPHTHCLHPQTNQKETTHLVFNVTKPAYYTPYMSNWGDINLEYNVCSYNVSKLSEIAEPQEPIQSDLVDVDILYKPFTYRDVCTIFHVKNENYDCTYNVVGGRLTAEVTRRQDVLLFGGLLVGVAVLVLLGVSITHFIICRRRRSARQRYQALHNVEEQV